MKKESENWLKIAKNDLKVAESLFKAGLYMNVIEHSHAALEKLLKGIIVDQNNENPPKIHNLLRLVSLTLIDNVGKDLKNTFEDLDDMYFSVRYPQDFDFVEATLSGEKVSKIFNEVKSIYKLLEKNLQ